MKKRYSIPKEECEVPVFDFYKNAAKIIGYPITNNTRFDCRKICITTPILKTLWMFYLMIGLADEEIVPIMLQFGPKASLEGLLYEFEVEDGFATEKE